MSSIFFSWQGDTSNKIGRTFLREVLEEVRENIASDASLNEALRDVAIDSDTQGVPGQPPIAETIFKKIDAASVFVADMTFTGSRLDGRPTPNPNVLIEYGWALKALSNGRVVCVMNTAFGVPNHETLPFDLAHLRWPIRYHLPKDSNASKRAAEKKRLVSALTEAIRLSLDAVPIIAPTLIDFPAAEAKDGPARFRGPSTAIGLEDDPYNGDRKEVFLAEGPAIWLRLMPLHKPDKEWTTQELKKAAKDTGLLYPLISPSGGYSYVRASDGWGMHRVRGGDTAADNKHAVHIDSVAFAFKTGEIWSIETALLNYAKDWLNSTDVEQVLADSLNRYANFLKTLGIDHPYRWEAGIIGTKGRRLGYKPPPGRQWVMEGQNICVTDIIIANGVYEVDQSPSTVLLPFFRKIFDECGVDRPDYLPQ